ncbi:MAG: hypothetical protein K8F52_05690 [Candidatus Scalindua rubra]|uniref:Uncharacterized protein n=1 Tax=Candidatus Scalindua brodae TaxID=237368 RepID=A0A0B0ERY1_9BACT|nr:MAG: hypothetical protein SCABRO_00856 [Candidatus Scalindua brodae]MBZ0108140.1 hypothetical protein [Candidatus Scalindua rubra]TWU31242.1 hypothetical protein S225a_21880 [Candidatus Brocadiaceae bacterium S225]
MSEKISVSLAVQVSGGPKISSTQSIAIEAYDSIKVTILGTAQGQADSDKEVEVQPGAVSGQVSFLAITSNRYDSNLTYEVNAIASGVVALDSPHILAGQGAVGLLDPAPTRLFFSSNIAENAEIHILVGRDATP